VHRIQTVLNFKSLICIPKSTNASLMTSSKGT
jgi:hypothetical protein